LTSHCTVRDIRNPGSLEVNVVDAQVTCPRVLVEEALRTATSDLISYGHGHASRESYRI